MFHLTGSSGQGTLSNPNLLLDKLGVFMEGLLGVISFIGMISLAHTDTVRHKSISLIGFSLLQVHDIVFLQLFFCWKSWKL